MISNDELDRLAATEVMGWTSFGDYWNTEAYAKGREQKKNSWQPSRNIAQAWELLEKMRDRNYFSSATELTLDSGQIDWIWHLKPYDNPMLHFVGRGTASLAITRACLLAKGVKIEP